MRTLIHGFMYPCQENSQVDPCIHLCTEPGVEQWCLSTNLSNHDFALLVAWAGNTRLLGVHVEGRGSRRVI